jgi:hypothetical protein
MRTDSVNSMHAMTVPLMQSTLANAAPLWSLRITNEGHQFSAKTPKIPIFWPAAASDCHDAGDDYVSLDATLCPICPDALIPYYDRSAWAGNRQ